jgi:hypothetical protein
LVGAPAAVAARVVVFSRRWRRSFYRDVQSTEPADQKEAFAMADRKIHLTIETLSGKYQHPFDPTTTLKQVEDETFAHLKMKPAPNDVWELQYNGATLSLSQTIEQAQLPDKAVLTLATKESGGGSPWTRR